MRKYLPIIGDRVKHYRMLKGLTQGELAEKVGVHINTIAKLEVGKSLPRADVLRKIADALTVEFTVLVPTEPMAEVTPKQISENHGHKEILVLLATAEMRRNELEKRLERIMPLFSALERLCSCRMYMDFRTREVRLTMDMAKLVGITSTQTTAEEVCRKLNDQPKCIEMLTGTHKDIETCLLDDKRTLCAAIPDRTAEEYRGNFFVLIYTPDY